MKTTDLRNQYTKETGTTWMDCKGNPSNEYVFWLENKVKAVYRNGFCDDCWANAFSKTFEDPSVTQSEHYNEIVKTCKHGK